VNSLKILLDKGAKANEQDKKIIKQIMSEQIE